MERLIIDTDPGVDDAQAIMMAAAYENAKIVALTVVAGNVGLAKTVANACKILDVVQLDLPVYAGCAQGLVIAGEDAAHVHGGDGLGDVGFPPSTREVADEHATLAILRLANENPGALTLVAIGPLTNIAVALTLDPKLPEKLKRFVIMGGAVTGHGNTSNISAEFNIFADPEAAHIVFAGWHRAREIFQLVDWETTMAHPIPNEVLARWQSRQNKRADFFNAMSAKTLKYVRTVLKRPHLLMADPLALAVTLEPSIVQKSAQRYVTVEINGRFTRGQTTVDWENRLQQHPNAEIILEIDKARFIQLVDDALR